jgi:hypothetical protein
MDTQKLYQHFTAETLARMYVDLLISAETADAHRERLLINQAGDANCGAAEFQRLVSFFSSMDNADGGDAQDFEAERWEAQYDAWNNEQQRRHDEMLDAIDAY